MCGSTCTIQVTYSISQEICTRFLLCCGYTLTDFPISIRLTSLALWQSNDCPSANKATMMNKDKYFMWIHYERLHNHNKAKHYKTVWIFFGIYCILGTSSLINLVIYHNDTDPFTVWMQPHRLGVLMHNIRLFTNGNYSHLHTNGCDDILWESIPLVFLKTARRKTYFYI